MTSSEPPLVGERDLHRLLATMEPVLDPLRYAFCRRPDTLLPPGTNPLGIFRESEAATLILDAVVAERLGYPADFLARRIILSTHSDLGAVGFLARISAALASAAIPSNVVSAVYHDHLFVPEQDADRALAILSNLQRTAADGGTTEVLYSVTVRVDAACAEEWLAWMRTDHVPAVLRAGGFLGCSISREIAQTPEQGRVVFVLDYRVPSLERLNAYRTEHSAALQQAHAERYAGRFEASRSIRAVLAAPSPMPSGA